MIEVHRILKDKLTGDVFDPETYPRYVALGHIHKNYRVRNGSNAWYCGSPPCSIDEAEDGTERGIYRIDIPLGISTMSETPASEKENPDFSLHAQKSQRS